MSGPGADIVVRNWGALIAPAGVLIDVLSVMISSVGTP
jgi:hypothetical protein